MLQLKKIVESHEIWTVVICQEIHILNIPLNHLGTNRLGMSK
jgi:hypothetical protein